MNTLGNIQSVAYSKDYFNLQLKFAQRITEITREDLSSVLFQYTSFYKSFRIEGWEFSLNNPIWNEFLNELNQNNNVNENIYNFYLKQIQLKGVKNEKKLFGCFSYEYDEDKHEVSIHFTNVDTPEPGALSKERMDVRTKELKQMFKEIKEIYPDAKTVTGFSWLYNIEAYKRLFPPEYIQNSKIITDWFRSTALWGQFLDSAGEIKKDLVAKFEKDISKANTVEELKMCFPFKLVKVNADIKYF